MQPGQILVADHEGVFIIRMTGDVRLTLCVSFDEFIKSMFSRDDFKAIVFDLTEAEAVDSTTLGFMAKISLLSKARHNVRPIILSASSGINRILDCMGFNEIFDIVSPEEMPEWTAADTATEALPVIEADEEQARQRVLEAHRILMGLNEQNRETFQDLVKALEDG